MGYLSPRDVRAINAGLDRLEKKLSGGQVFSPQDAEDLIVVSVSPMKDRFPSQASAAVQVRNMGYSAIGYKEHVDRHTFVLPVAKAVAGSHREVEVITGVRAIVAQRAD